nr:class I SAM-dependent methyltransferase [Nocardioides sambongensis]
MGNENGVPAGGRASVGRGGAAVTPPEILEHGVRVTAEPDRVVDVAVDGRRIWSFRTGNRAAAAGPDGRVTVEWAPPLRRRLRGFAEISVLEAGAELARREFHFPGSQERASFTDRAGRPLVIGPNGRLMLSFGDHAESVQPLLEAAHRVLAVMADAGVRGFLAYGTLLGAVREGDFIGHDNDVDLGYVSAAPHPVDVVLESLRLQHAFTRAGMRVERYSGAGLKIWVQDSSGIDRGLDVFGGFWDGDRLAFLGELHTPFERSWIEPLGEVTLAGETFPAPARPEKLLEAMYGPAWKVPDPTFVFEPGTDARARLNRWFRGIRVGRNSWDSRYAPAVAEAPPKKPHHLARVVHDHEPGALVVDIGCGRGRDAVWLAEQGHRVIGLDFSAIGPRHLATEVADSDLDVEFRSVNLLELQHVLAWGARLARMPGPRTVMARHLVNATTARGRQGMWRMAAMALADGGRLYLEFLGADEPRAGDGTELVWEVRPAVIAAEAERYGGTVKRLWPYEMNFYEVPPRGPAGDPAPRDTGWWSNGPERGQHERAGRLRRGLRAHPHAEDDVAARAGRRDAHADDPDGGARGARRRHGGQPRPLRRAGGPGPGAVAPGRAPGRDQGGRAGGAVQRRAGHRAGGRVARR